MTKYRDRAALPNQQTAPTNAAFNALLGETVRAWGAQLAVQQEAISDDRLLITVYYGDVAIQYTYPLLDDRIITPSNAASALWAMTSALWRSPTLDEFVATNKPGEWYDEWLRVARECIAVFGREFGNDALLKERADHPLEVGDGLG